MQVNYFKIFNAFVQHAKKSGTVEKSGEHVAKISSEGKNSLRSNSSANQNTSISAQNIQFSRVNFAEQAKLVRQLLNLPDDIEQLLSFLVYKKVSPEALKNLLKQGNKKLDINLLKQLLETNSKESAGKLIKLLGQTPGGTRDTEQLKQILTLLNSVVPQKNATPQDVLTGLILMYLPWLPLAELQDVKIRLEEQKEKGEDESGEVALVVYITTINLGRFRISITLEKDLSLKTEIEHFEEEKSENREDTLEKIMKEINSQARKDNINVKTELLISKQKQITEKNEKEREIVISPAAGISPVMIITAQKIAKIILETDEKISLLKARAKMAE